MELVAASPPRAPTPITVGCSPPPHHLSHYVYWDDNLDQNNNNNNISTCSSSISTSCPSPTYQLRLQPLLRSPKHNLSLRHDVAHYDTSGFSSQPLQPLLPQTTTTTTSTSTCTTWGRRMRKKKARKWVDSAHATTSDILRLMDALGFPISIDIYTSLIQECTAVGDPETAIELHTHISRSRIRLTLPLLNRLLIMFVSCGLLDSARHLFDSMPVKDLNSWATLFVGYFDNAEYKEATSVFLTMLSKLGMLEMPSWIWDCLLKTCACSENFWLGKQVHGWLLKLGICDDIFLTCSLISFYRSLSCFKDANIAFNRVSRHNTLTWTAKIVSDCREEHFFEAISDFGEMGRQGIKKNSFTFSSVLKACGRMPGHERCGEQVHAHAIKLGLISDNYVQCGLIDMYGRSGLLRDAKQVFEMSRNERNVACWNAMLMGYLHHDLYIEAIKFLYQMKAAGMQPQESLLKQVRIACGSITY